MSTRVYLSTYPYPTTPEEETPVCRRIQLSHATVKELQSHLQWTFRMMSESSNAPFLRWCSVFASHREPHGVADTMIEALLCIMSNHRPSEDWCGVQDDKNTSTLFCRVIALLPAAWRRARPVA